MTRNEFVNEFLDRPLSTRFATAEWLSLRLLEFEKSIRAEYKSELEPPSKDSETLAAIHRLLGCYGTPHA